MSSNVNANPFVLSQILSVSPFRNFIGIPHVLWGSPGIGKTTFINSFANAIGRKCITVIGSLLEPQDIIGYPYHDNKCLKFLPPDFLFCLQENSILFLDELTCSSPSIQHALLRLILERRSGDFTIPNGCIIVSAANPPSISGGYELSSPLLNRFCHIIIPPMVDSYINYLLGDNDFCIDSRIVSVVKSERDYECFRNEVIKAIPKYKIVLASLLKKEPKHYLSLDVAADNYAFPTPRSWEFALIARAVCDVLELGQDYSFEVIKCSVGESSAIAFVAEEKNSRIPDIDELLAGRASIPVNIREDEVFIITKLVLGKICVRDIEGSIQVNGLQIIFSMSKDFPDAVFPPLYDFIKSGKMRMLAEKGETRAIIHKIGENVSKIAQVFKTAF